VSAPEKYLSYNGIRVMDLDRSLKFYTELFGLKEVARGDSTAIGRGIFVLLRDPWSGQNLELNWYPEGSQFATPYVTGEGLDHIAFRVADLPKFVGELRKAGVPGAGESVDFELPSGVRVAFVKDPDGNWIGLFDIAHVPMTTTRPEGY
jgi:lactoylglutathione lyase